MIYQLLYDHAKRFPERTAIVSGDICLTYIRLIKQVDAISRELLDLGITDSLIALAGPNQADAVALLFGIAKSGNRVLPIDYYQTRDEFLALCDQTKVDYICIHSEFKSGLLDEKSTPDSVDLRTTNRAFSIIPRNGAVLHKPVKGNWFKNLFGGKSQQKSTEYTVKTDTVCLLFSSSGSTGKPKVFPLTHSQLYYQMTYLRDATPFLRTDSTLCSLHFSHSHAICLIFGALGSGGAIHLMRVQDALAPKLANYIIQHQITIFSHVPLVYKAFVDLHKHLPQDCFVNIRIAICGSAPLSAEVARSFYDRYGIHMHQGYGLSEIGTICLNNFDEGIYNYHSVGKVFPEIEYKIIDESGEAVPTGEEGHLIARSAGLTDGYIDNPEANALMFRDGWLYTQDIVKEDQYGNIQIIGRMSNFINVGGFKVFPAEIERAIMNIPEVAEVAVIDQEDGFFGQIAKAFVVLHESGSIRAEDIQQYCRRELSSFKVPKEIEFLSELPKNGIGKVVTSKLRQR